MKLKEDTAMKEWKRIVVKVGTSTLAYPGYRLNIRRVEKLVKVLSDIKNSGTEVLLVSSGAIAMGIGKLGLQKRPSDLAGKQACAAIGQCELMYIYDKLFSEYNHTVAQVLLTGDDLKNPSRRENFKNTIEKLVKLGSLPILNENDTVSTTEITSIGDNDTLAALVSETADADLLILLSDIDGLYTADPKKDKNATIIHHVSAVNKQIKALAGGAGSDQGTGGMATKVNAAEICLKDHIDMVIANGDDPMILYDILNGKEAGTLFSSDEQ
jgi:glutamate 5-kinase